MQPILIQGTWGTAAAARSIEITNPATGKPLDRTPECDSHDVARAVDAARYAQPGWAQTPPSARTRLIGGLAAGITHGRQALASLLAAETGKPLCEAIDCLDAAIAIFDACATAHAAEDSAFIRYGSGLERPSWLPACSGVIAVLPSSDFPVLLLACVAGPALAAGHTLVCRPPTRHPLTCLKLAQLFAEFPPGVVNFLTGDAETARSLAQNRGVDLVVGAGASVTGAADPFRRRFVDLTEGDCGAFLVCRDANLDLAVRAIAAMRLLDCGQSPVSRKHIYVDREKSKPFIEQLHGFVGLLDVDDPRHASTDLGPLRTREAAHRVEDEVAMLLRSGAKLILGGRRFSPSGLPGHFFQPTILSDVRPDGDHPLPAIHGPVLTITATDGPAEALALARGAGLAANLRVFSTDPAAVLAPLTMGGITGVIAELAPPAHEATPLGTVSAAYRRRLHGAATDLEHQASSVLVTGAVDPKPWWFPYSNRRTPRV